MKSKVYILLSFLFLVSGLAMGQGFLHTDGKNIVDGNGENFLIRSIGTGNWMIMEGYMMKSNGPADTHTEFRNKLVETIGTEKPTAFILPGCIIICRKKMLIRWPPGDLIPSGLLCITNGLLSQLKMNRYPENKPG